MKLLFQGFLVSSVVIDGLRLEGNVTVLAADADVDVEIVDSIVANGGRVFLHSDGALTVSPADSEILQGVLSIDGPLADVGITRTVFDRTRVDVPRGAALTVTGGEVLVGAERLSVSTDNTQLFDVTVRLFPGASTCDAGIVVDGGSAHFNGVRLSDLPCPALIVRDEGAVIDTIVLGAASQDQGVRFDNNLLDLSKTAS